MTGLTANQPTWIEKATTFTALWVARLVLATLAVAGTLHLLGGVDPIIKYPVSVVLVAFLVKETL